MRESQGSGGLVRAPQSLVAGLGMIGLGLFGVWAASDLDRGTLAAIGPGLMPHWLAVGVVACGVALLVASLVKSGDAMDSWALRGPLVVFLAIVLFAVTIRPFDLRFAQTPGLGLAAAGPLAIIVGGYASPEARLRDLLILALALTSFCMLLFGDLLNLPIPLFPLWVSDLFPATWSNEARLQSISLIYAVVAAAIWAATRRRAPADEPIDVAPPAQQGY